MASCFVLAGRDSETEIAWWEKWLKDSQNHRAASILPRTKTPVTCVCGVLGGLLDLCSWKIKTTNATAELFSTTPFNLYESLDRPAKVSEAVEFTYRIELLSRPLLEYTVIYTTMYCR